MAIPADAFDGVRTVLFDAGGVLLDLDYAYLLRLLEARRVHTDRETLSWVEAEARVEMHRRVEAGGRVGEAWRDYFHLILGRAGLPGGEHEAAIDALWEAHRRFGLWTVAIDGALEVVRELAAAGYRLGVVSNAEGHVARDLDGAGYAGLFETVVDSHRVGIEKPDPRIFEIALRRMQARRETTLFIGDVPAVDVAGARAVGCLPLLLDRHGIYGELDVPRIRDLTDLRALLRRRGERTADPPD